MESLTRTLLHEFESSFELYGPFRLCMCREMLLTSCSHYQRLNTCGYRTPSLQSIGCCLQGDTLKAESGTLIAGTRSKN
ncbi:hypothetical protein B0I35DRAFT_231807 [Stachybotrys elegans]|uniref:Uncharacterized protein n=1 Tax=Stachybotrys elegans TaxID=80388 RepID=A0A8K0ST97_9HYPO|nr:hypothetical protein B0I35DRAFT_231807 [Stachybotrys elegans]